MSTVTETEFIFPNKERVQQLRKNNVYPILLEGDSELKTFLWKETKSLLRQFFPRKKDTRKRERFEKQLEQILNSEGITDSAFRRKRTTFLKEVY